MRWASVSPLRCARNGNVVYVPVSSPSTTPTPPSGATTSAYVLPSVGGACHATVDRSIQCAFCLLMSVSALTLVTVDGSNRPGVAASSHTSRPALAKSSRWSSGRSLVSPWWMT